MTTRSWFFTVVAGDVTKHLPRNVTFRGICFMELKPKSLEELKKIMKRDYGASLSDSEANELGGSLLRLTKMAGVALARAEEKNSFIQARASTKITKIHESKI